MFGEMKNFKPPAAKELRRNLNSNRTAQSKCDMELLRLGKIDEDDLMYLVGP